MNTMIIGLPLLVLVALFGGMYLHSYLRCRALSLHLPYGFSCNEYSNAFDTGPGKCQFCSTSLLQLRKQDVRVSPRGETFDNHTTYIGVACPRCLVASKDDLSSNKFVPLEEFIKCV